MENDTTIPSNAPGIGYITSNIGASGSIIVTNSSFAPRWKFCPDCGSHLPPDWKHCAGCGRLIGSMAWKITSGY